MNRRSILTKTGKGLMEATGKTSNLSRDLRNILKEIDGKVSVSELMQKFSRMTEPELLEALKSMERDGYLREFVGKQDEAPRPSIPRAPTSPSSADGGEDLDFTAFPPAHPSAKSSEDARLQAQAQDIARQAQATRAREEARRGRGPRPRRGQERRPNREQGFQRRPARRPRPRRERRRKRSIRRGARPKSGSAGKPKKRRAAKPSCGRESRRTRPTRATPRSASAGKSMIRKSAETRRRPGARPRRAHVAKRKRKCAGTPRSA